MHRDQGQAFNILLAQRNTQYSFEKLSAFAHFAQRKFWR